MNFSTFLKEASKNISLIAQNLSMSRGKLWRGRTLRHADLRAVASHLRFNLAERSTKGNTTAGADQKVRAANFLPFGKF
jgi:hypothetical protein